MEINKRLDYSESFFLIKKLKSNKKSNNINTKVGDNPKVDVHP